MLQPHEIKSIAEDLHETNKDAKRFTRSRFPNWTGAKHSAVKSLLHRLESVGGVFQCGKCRYWRCTRHERIPGTHLCTECDPIKIAAMKLEAVA